MAEVRESAELLDFRVSALEEVVKEIRVAVVSIDGSLRTLAVLETKHDETRSALARAFSEIGKLNDRTSCIELEMQSLKMVRNWVLVGVLSCVAMVGTAVASMVLHQ